MTQEILDKTGQRMTATVADAQKKLSSVRTGRASIALLDGISVDYYGTPTPVNQLAKLLMPYERDPEARGSRRPRCTHQSISSDNSFIASPSSSVRRTRSNGITLPPSNRRHSEKSTFSAALPLRSLL